MIKVLANLKRESSEAEWWSDVCGWVVREEDREVVLEPFEGDAIMCEGGALRKSELRRS